MKKINIVLSLLLVLLAWGCEDESNLEPLGNWELSDPMALPVNDGETIVLNDETPQETITFNWESASSSANYGIYYTVLIDSLDATDSNAPIAEITALEDGKGTSASITTMDLNDALYMAGYKAGIDLELTWTVVANCLSKQTTNAAALTVVRYDDDKLFLAGDATEVGTSITDAIWMNRKLDASGEKLNLYESYTMLKANEPFMVYNGRSENAVKYGLSEEGNLVKDGTALTVDTEGIYRVVIDFDLMTIEFHNIDRLGVIGAPLENGWDADEALEYKGMGVWQSDISFISSGSFILRTNDNWDYLLKNVTGTANEVMAESDAGDVSIAVEDFQVSEAGFYTVTVSLTGEGYTLDMEKAPESRMYLIVNSSDTYELTMIGDGIYTTSSYLALQTSDQVIVNTESDGSGISYSTSESIGEGSGDKVEGTVTLSELTSAFSPSKDQAYGFTVDISAGELTWHYYNMKLFHWIDNGGWDDRLEIEMTYQHPYTYTLTQSLLSTHDSKFNSPWDISFGSDDANALSGTMTNGGGTNFTNITADGTYTITIEVSNDFSTGSYSFVAE